MVVKRAADNTYAQFEYRYTGVVFISKAIRTIDTIELEANRKGYNFLDLKPAENAIDDLSDKASFTYEAVKTDGKLLFPGDSGSGKPGESNISGLLPETDYYITVKVTGDPKTVWIMLSRVYLTAQIIPLEGFMLISQSGIIILHYLA